jgi:histidinol dehydrogenase
VGKKATNAIAEHFANAKTIIVPQERKNAVRIEQMINENVMNAPEQHIMTNLTIKELKRCIRFPKEKEVPRKGWHNQRNAH